MAAFLCSCGQGHELWGEFWWLDGQHQWVYFDDDRRSETYTEQVENCPECGKRLERKGLMAIHSTR
jgi:hypothetical protein